MGDEDDDDAEDAESEIDGDTEDVANVRGLAGHLLVAVPQLLDPNFHRAVVLMLAHGGEAGGLGLILNAPTDTDMEDVATSLGLEWCGDPHATCRVGGPLEPARGWILHDLAEWDEDADEVAPGVWLTTALGKVMEGTELQLGVDEAPVVFLLGYAGWGHGQLEAEIAAGSWIIVPILGVGETASGQGVEPRWLLETEPAEMWTAALSSLGIKPERIVGLQGGRELH